jgi:tripartite-type tricarboxylate transporter receptor subunit TctC
MPTNRKNQRAVTRLAALGRFALLALALNFTALPSGALAKERVEVLASTNPGGAPDVIARVIADILNADGFQAVTRNIPGANGEVAIRGLLNGAAEGLTLMVAQSSIVAINPHIYGRTEKELWRHAQPLLFIGRSSANFLLVADGSVRTLGDLIAKKMREGAPLRYGTPGIGSFPHLMLEEILVRKGSVERIHVPYKSANEALQGLVAGDTDIVISGTAALPLLSSGRVHPVAVAGDRVSPKYPAASPLGLEFKGLNFTPWFALFANPRTSPQEQLRIRSLLQAQLGQAKHRERLASAGVDVEFLDEAQLIPEMKREWDFFKLMVERLKIDRQ